MADHPIGELLHALPYERAFDDRRIELRRIDAQSHPINPWKVYHRLVALLARRRIAGWANEHETSYRGTSELWNPCGQFLLPTNLSGSTGSIGPTVMFRRASFSASSLIYRAPRQHPSQRRAVWTKREWHHAVLRGPESDKAKGIFQGAP